MIGIILAAGIGKRLMPLTKDISKTLIKVGDREILEYIIRGFISVGIKKVRVVVGHGKEKLIKELKRLSERYGFDFDTVENEIYRDTNTGYSLLKALNLDGLEDIVIVNGDVVFDFRILRNLVEEDRTSIVVDNVKKLTKESFKVKIRDGLILSMGKEVPIEESSGEFIGISLVKKEDYMIFRKILEDIVSRNVNEYYDVAFKELCKVKPLNIVYTNGLRWTEIDFPEDLEYAKKLVKSIMLEV